MLAEASRRAMGAVVHNGCGRSEQTPEAMGADHTYEWKDLVSETKGGHKETAASKDHDVNTAAAWARVKLYEALALAEGRQETEPEDAMTGLTPRRGLL